MKPPVQPPPSATERAIASLVDDMTPLSFVERVARLEERMTTLVTMLDEIRRDQKEFAEIVARASGGFRVLLLLGGLAGLVGALRNMMSWTNTLFSSNHGN
jgi:hypothetical protein